MNLRRVMFGAAAGAALVLGTLAAPAAQATSAGTAAVTCGNAYWPHSPVDGTVGSVTKSTSAAAHTGPYGACTTVGHIAPGTPVEYDCYVWNDYGNSWTWVREPNGASLGWVYDAYLEYGGSNEPC
ncbi:hypothetical protein [Streptomyces sp. AC627_RSS907]|uniref:hypothetical protein n=1 Tax=Streptomyces sp. AC627_RSS907 TaxID=2823684 RepID=UPI001C2313BC|nr:hypothetical protein [Streptomyces sp. AC627_RSS907]